LEYAVGSVAHETTRETGSRAGAHHHKVDSFGHHELADDILRAATTQFQLYAREAIPERLGETREVVFRAVSGVVQVRGERDVGRMTKDLLFADRPPRVQKDQGSFL
jgi:hypothetical protein